jgi:hypothetical protein
LKGELKLESDVFGIREKVGGKEEFEKILKFELKRKNV